MFNVILAILAISLLIIIHELGHLVMAKAVGMRAEVFSVGFGPRLWGHQWGETMYQVAAVPLGGYVRVSGESPEEGGGKPYEFWSKSPGQRALFVVGGVVMNFLLAIILFIGAFSIGVPFIEGTLGSVQHGSRAWEAGLKAGDEVLAVNDKQDPTFEDMSRAIMLGEGSQAVTIKVRRNGEVRTYDITPRFDKQMELRRIGITPLVETEIAGFHSQGEAGISPAREAGIQVGDRLVALEGVPVSAHYEVTNQLINHPEGPVSLTIERGGTKKTVTVAPEPVMVYRKGISGLTPEINALQGEGPAQRLGLQPGDVMLSIDGEPVESAVGFIEALRGSVGEPVSITAARGDEELSFNLSFSSRLERYEFVESIEFVTSNTVQWVEADSPAEAAGIIPGDVITEVNGHEVETWQDVLQGSRGDPDKPDTMVWMRGDERMSAEVHSEKVAMEDQRMLGLEFRVALTDVRESVPGAVVRGVRSTFSTLGEIFVTISRIISADVGPKNMGGIITISRVSYRAAEQGFGKLLYMTAIISASLAFLNILPIPVLDGGHLVFLAIEKIRGRRLSERTMTILQSIGFAALILLVVFVTWNDIARLVN